MRNYVIHVLLAIAGLFTSVTYCTVIADTELGYSGPNLYIFYNGTISGELQYGDNQRCFLGTYSKAYLFVGVNSNSDKNPFFFDLFHWASDVSDGRPGGVDERPPKPSASSNPKRQITERTNDNIYALDFATIRKGHDILDLNSSKIEQVKFNGETGYQVTGDTKSLITETQQTNYVSVLAECDRDLPQSYVWSIIASNFSYNLTFTNTTAAMSLTNTTAAMTNLTNTTPTLISSGSTLSLSFSGSRVSYYMSNPDHDYDITYNYSIHAPDNVSGLKDNDTIQLVTSDPSTPKFQYVNGSNFYFVNCSMAPSEWDPTAEEADCVITTNISTPTPTPSSKPNSAIGSTVGNWWWVTLVELCVMAWAYTM